MLTRLAALALVAAAPLAPPAWADQLADGFAEADLNSDGSLNADEYLAAIVTEFATRDTDRDGRLTRAELPEASPAALSRIDRNGDGMISIGEGAGDRIVRFFDADANRDGLLTLAELRAYVDALKTETSK
jgi:Ca2+-binding EF-hand superfamily protein